MIRALLVLLWLVPTIARADLVDAEGVDAAEALVAPACGAGTMPCGSACIPTGTVCCGCNGTVCAYCPSANTCIPNPNTPYGYSCCPTGQKLCHDGCIPSTATCCGGNFYCTPPATCTATGCSNGTSMPPTGGGTNNGCFAGREPCGNICVDIGTPCCTNGAAAIPCPDPYTCHIDGPAAGDVSCTRAAGGCGGGDDDGTEGPPLRCSSTRAPYGYLLVLLVVLVCVFRKRR